MNRILLTVIFLFFAGLHHDEVQAGALYDPKVKGDEALVRVLNLTGKVIKLEVKSHNKRINKIASFTLSPYIRVKQGDANLSVNDQLMAMNARATQHYTLVVTPKGSLKLLNDPKITKKGKSMFLTYNFSKNKTLSLKTADGKNTIITAISPQTSAHRQINAVGLTVALYVDNKRIFVSSKQNLHKNVVKNIIVIDTDSGIAVNVIDSKVNTRI